MSVTSSGTYGLVKDSIRRHARIKEFFFKGFFPRGGGGRVQGIIYIFQERGSDVYFQVQMNLNFPGADAPLFG